MFHSVHVNPDNVHDKFAKTRVPSRSFPQGTLSLLAVWQRMRLDFAIMLFCHLCPIKWIFITARGRWERVACAIGRITCVFCVWFHFFKCPYWSFSYEFSILRNEAFPMCFRIEEGKFYRINTELLLFFYTCLPENDFHPLRLIPAWIYFLEAFRNLSDYFIIHVRFANGKMFSKIFL